MKTAFPALLLALRLLRVEAAPADGYEASLRAVCQYLIDRSKRPAASEPCGNGNDACATNIEDQLDKKCEPKYGNESRECDCNGRWIGREAVTRIAPGSSYKDPDVEKDLCLSHGLSNVYKTQMEKHAGILKMFTGFFSGAHYTYPATNWRQSTDSETKCRHNLDDGDKCPDYDPRTRVWFIAAAVGPKNVILLLDISGSLKGDIVLLKNAATAVIDTLTHVDFLGIIAFSDILNNWRDELQPANPENRKDAKTFLAGLVEAGDTDFEIAFEETHQMITRSYDKGSVTGCKTAIIFYTDGDSDKPPWGGIEKLKEKERNVFVFSYTLGSRANQAVPRRIACETRGVHQHIEKPADLSASMTTYWRVLAGGRDGTQATNEVVWSEIYLDFLGLGEVISPGLKCQADDRLLAVAGLDIFETHDPDIFKSDLKNRSTTCPYFSITDDELAAIRDHSCDADSAPRHPFMGMALVLLASLVMAGFETRG